MGKDLRAILTTAFFLGAIATGVEILLPLLTYWKPAHSWHAWKALLTLREYGFPLALFQGILWATAGGIFFLIVRRKSLTLNLLWAGTAAAAAVAFSPFIGAIGAIAGWRLRQSLLHLSSRRLGRYPSLNLWKRRVITAGLLGTAIGWVGTAIQRTGWTANDSAEAAPSEAPNVLILTIDSLRVDHVSLYGYPAKTTPSIDAFAKEGAAVFRDCQSHATWTKPAVASMITGRLPGREVRLDERGALPSREETLTERFHRFGYQTGWFAANPNLAPEFGMSQRSDGLLVPRKPGLMTRQLFLGRRLERLWQKAPPLRPLLRPVYFLADLANGNWYRPSWIRDEELRDAFLDWLPRKPGERPWFAYIHFMAVHSPYGDMAGKRLAPPSLGHDERYKRELPIHAPPLPPDLMAPYLEAYDEDIPYTDACIGQIVEVLRERGDLERTLVVVTADHGEEFGEHGLVGHGILTFHRGVTHVPLIVKIPGMRKMAWVDAPVQHIDLVPTLLSLCKLPEDAALPGRNLFRLNNEAVWSPVRFYQAYHDEPRWRLAMLRSGDNQLYLSKTARGVETALFDLALDPTEENNLAPLESEQVKGLMAEVARFDPSW